MDYEITFGHFEDSVDFAYNMYYRGEKVTVTLYEWCINTLEEVAARHNLDF